LKTRTTRIFTQQFSNHGKVKMTDERREIAKLKKDLCEAKDGN